jgi:Uncharacterized alpha/beta hydrolase domain (DUF2235)
MRQAVSQSLRTFAGSHARSASGAWLARVLANQTFAWYAPQQANWGQTPSGCGWRLALRSWRLGSDPKCLLLPLNPRVASPLGQIHIPRKGQEVLVDFERGDPDRPITIGQLNNSTNQLSWALPAIINMNVYGFSRGAAAARYFVHLVKTERDTYAPKWKGKNVRVNFVGLFDTVSSYGGNFSNDVSDLHLNFDDGAVQRVVHLVAGDEYRENFASTTIASAGDKGYELTMPGAHSDVGGGYNADPEVRDLYAVQEERNPMTGKVIRTSAGTRDFVYDQGWYSAKNVIDGKGLKHSRSVSLEYAKVAHSVMVDKANDYFKASIFADPAAPSHPLALKLHTDIRAFAKDEKNRVWSLNDKWGMDKARATRNALFHLSFRGEGLTAPHRPHLDANGRISRQQFAG